MNDRSPLLARHAYPTSQSIGTRWLDNDMYGHVNNIVYYGWFDTVVNNWLIRSGLLTLNNDPLIGLVVQSSCRYASPLAYPDVVEIGLMADHIGNSSVTYRLGAFAQDADEAAAEGLFTHVYVDAATRRPARLPEQWRSVLATISPH